MEHKRWKRPLKWTVKGFRKEEIVEDVKAKQYPLDWYCARQSGGAEVAEAARRLYVKRATKERPLVTTWPAARVSAEGRDEATGRKTWPQTDCALPLSGDRPV